MPSAAAFTTSVYTNLNHLVIIFVPQISIVFDMVLLKNSQEVLYISHAKFV